MKRTLFLPLWWKACRNLPIPLSLHLPPPFSSKQALHHIILCPLLSGVISHLISSSILGTYWPGEFIFECPIFLPFHTVHGVLKPRILKWFAIPFSSGHALSELSTMVVHSFIELDKAVVHVLCPLRKVNISLHRQEPLYLYSKSPAYDPSRSELPKIWMCIWFSKEPEPVP